MFSLSFWEVFFIISIALIVLKPSDVPVIAKQIGKMIRSVKSYFADFTDMFDDSGNAKTKSLTADDGLEYEAYDVEDVMADLKASKNKAEKTTKTSTKKKPKTKSKAKVKTKAKPKATKKVPAKKASPKKKTSTKKAKPKTGATK